MRSGRYLMMSSNQVNSSYLGGDGADRTAATGDSAGMDEIVASIRKIIDEDRIVPERSRVSWRS